MARQSFLIISILISFFIIKYSYSKIKNVENFSNKILNLENLNLDNLKYGYMNTFYSELSKEPFELLKEPLPLHNLPNFPSNTSEKTKNECKKLYEITNLESENRKDIAEIRRKFKKIDKDPLKPFLDFCKQKKLKVNVEKLETLVKDCAIISLKLKSIYNRPRPYQLCYIYGYPIKLLKSEHSDTPSYPSSFALQSYVLGYIIGNKHNKYQGELEKITNEISMSRVYSGNNFESDIECSKIIMFNLRGYLDTINI